MDSSGNPGELEKAMKDPNASKWKVFNGFCMDSYSGLFSVGFAIWLLALLGVIPPVFHYLAYVIFALGGYGATLKLMKGGAGNG